MFPRNKLSEAINELSQSYSRRTENAKSQQKPKDFRQSVSEALSLLTRYSFSIYVDDDRGRPDLIGTGFIVQRDDDYFFVTAKHVYDHKNRGSLYFYNGINTKRYITGSVRHSPWVGQEPPDQVDIAVVKLDDKALPPYISVEKHAVNIKHLGPQRTPRAGRTYAFIGHPISKSHVRNDKNNIYVTPTAYYNEAIDDDAYPDWLNSDTHIVIGWNGKKSMNAEGKKTQFPKPQGMSGSPIIELCDTELQDPPDFFPIVGVATDYRTNKK